MANRLAKKTRKHDFEKEVLTGDILNTHEEVNLIKSHNTGGRNFVYPLYQKRLQFFVYEFLKTYLYALSSGALSNEEIQITNLASMASNANPVMTAPQIASYTEEGLALIENHSLYAHLIYKGASYQVTVFLVNNMVGMFNELKYFISVLGNTAESHMTETLATYLVQQCIMNSVYKNCILNLKFDSEERVDIEKMDASEFRNESLDDIFIPKTYKNELLKFYRCVDEYDNIKTRLRYMLSGKPGTGKTKSVRTLINMCYKKATIILTEGEIDFKALFDFAKLFEPAIICLDDIDLVVGSRSHHYSPYKLGSFLQELDGFDKNNVFILATTNDKDLVDIAASRPLRFDLTIDFGKLDVMNYTDLLKANTKDESLLEIFDDSLIDSLKKKKITGAFLVNLIHQAEIMKKLDPKTNLKEYMKSFIEMSYKGFYNQYKDEQQGFGFNIDHVENDVLIL